MFNTRLVPSNIFTNYSKRRIYLCHGIGIQQNSYCDHRNFDSVNQSLSMARRFGQKNSRIRIHVENRPKVRFYNHSRFFGYSRIEIQNPCRESAKSEILQPFEISRLFEIQNPCRESARSEILQPFETLAVRNRNYHHRACMLQHSGYYCVTGDLLKIHSNRVIKIAVGDREDSITTWRSDNIV
jgi:hypothetical protein